MALCVSLKLHRLFMKISDKDLKDRVVLKFKDTVKALKEAKLYASEEYCQLRMRIWKLKPHQS